MEKDKARLPQQRGRRRNAKRCMSRKRLILLVALLIVHTALNLIQFSGYEAVMLDDGSVAWQRIPFNQVLMDSLIGLLAVFLWLGANLCLCYGKKKAACVQSILAVLAVLAALTGIGELYIVVLAVGGPDWYGILPFYILLYNVMVLCAAISKKAQWHQYVAFAASCLMLFLPPWPNFPMAAFGGMGAVLAFDPQWKQKWKQKSQEQEKKALENTCYPALEAYKSELLKKKEGDKKDV